MRLVTLALLSMLLPSAAHADRLDDFVRNQLQRRHVPGLSLAIVDGGKIVRAQGYGVTDLASKRPVTPSTLFQAGSVSKSVAAVAALRLVEQGRLSLDENVNARLTTWKVPENRFTATEKVTLRRLLSHTAGLTVHGFPGYAIDAPKPTLVQVLNGEKPANTPAIRVDIVPGETWRYSGGGYTVLQQLLLDMTGKSFPDLMREEVLDRAGMRDSSFEQPLPPPLAAQTAGGHYPGEHPVPGRWHVYPEMAAAGLWTTPSDLARFAIAVQQAYAGRRGAFLSNETARLMLTRQKQDDGLGLFLEGEGRALRFTHGGRDDGFDAMLVGYAEAGKGAAIMINANENEEMVPRILERIAREYHWRGYPLRPEYAPIPDREPAVAALVKEFHVRAAAGTLQASMFTPAFWKDIGGKKDDLRRQVTELGPIRSVTLVERKVQDGLRRYRYRIVFRNATLLVLCVLTRDGKIAGIAAEP